jgi:hypothetical protein
MLGLRQQCPKYAALDFVMVLLACHLVWIEQHLENWQGTVLGVSVRVSPETIGVWVSDLCGKVLP